MTSRWPFMYGPTMRGGMTFRIGVPGIIREGCAGSRTAEPKGRAPFPTMRLVPVGPHTWPRRVPRTSLGLRGLPCHACALHTLCLVDRSHLPQSAAFVMTSTHCVEVSTMWSRGPGGKVGAMAAQRHQFSGRFSRPAGDTGEADPVVTAALGAWHRGAGSERDALLAVAGTRLLVPVVAILLARNEETGADKESEMALPTL